jgi:hypothetical protein
MTKTDSFKLGSSKSCEKSGNGGEGGGAGKGPHDKSIGVGLKITPSKANNGPEKSRLITIVSTIVASLMLLAILLLMVVTRRYLLSSERAPLLQ